MNDLSIADERNVGINMVEVTQGDQAEVGEDRRRKEYQRLAYPIEEENPVEFIKRCQKMRTEVMLCPGCSAIFDRKAATNLEAVDKAKKKENWGTVRYDPRRSDHHHFVGRDGSLEAHLARKVMFCLCFSLPEPRCWLVGRALALALLDARSVLLTIFPNYNVILNDNTLPTRLKVQVQITGIDQVPEAMSATLHHQMIYRLQNHSIDLPLSGCSFDSLLVITNREEDIPSIVQIPRRITREELTQLIPLEWITNYERLHVDRRPIQSQ
ncbi:hypothetical protein KIW84_024076 [Lathyrus oleraceus]|uniref:Uncharacterized protein n=1 Tax=Pisum sativum TaxID=3888 RepID=A0A9D4YEM6_PEA|nr:hypothetical protein KIW84_024076 [Pisum sativum]